VQQAEVAVVGGGPAGLAAALTAVRARRVVVVIDEGAPRNASSPGVHGFLSRDGITPAALRGAAREQLEPYDRATVLDGRVERITGDLASGFTLEGVGDPVRAARVVLATGMRDQLPQLAGFAHLWGHSVIHCPYCHGWEVAGRRWGVVAYDQPSVARKVEFYGNWTDDLILFAGDDVAGDAVQLSRNADVAVERRPIVGLDARGHTLRGVRVAGGERIAVGALVWPVRQRLPGLIADLGLALDADGHVAVDRAQRTSRPGIYAAGDVTSFRQQQVVHAASSGVAAAKAVVEDLTAARSRVVAMA
jgi:thioredoxin reductase